MLTASYTNLHAKSPHSHSHSPLVAYDSLTARSTLHVSPPHRRLSLNTVYYYAVGGSNSGTSATYNFTSHPLPSVPLTFAIIGDLGQTANSVDTLNHVLSHRSVISSIIHVGDIR